MAIRAHFEELGSGEERRSRARRALRLDATGDFRDVGPATVLIHDLSLTGVLIETATKLDEGDAFTLELPEAGAIETTAVWSSGRFYGCRFRSPISPAALSSALLQSSPRTPPGEQPPVDVVAELRDINAQVDRIAEKLHKAVSDLSEADRKPDAET